MTDETVIRSLNSSITIFSKPFSRFGIFRIGGRGTVVKTRANNLLVFSPVALTPLVKAKIEDLGAQVKFLVAPDYEHHLFIGEWKKAYPQAVVIGVEGLPDKRKDVNFDYVFTKDESLTLPQSFTDEFDAVYFPGFVNKDLVVYHRPTKTLLEADLLFNLPAHEQYSKSTKNPKSGVTFLFNALTWQSTWSKRFLYYVGSVDRVSMAERSKIVDGFDKSVIIPCHGEIMNNGNEAWKEVHKWFLEKSA